MSKKWVGLTADFPSEISVPDAFQLNEEVHERVPVIAERLERDLGVPVNAQVFDNWFFWYSIVKKKGCLLHFAKDGPLGPSWFVGGWNLDDAIYGFLEADWGVGQISEHLSNQQVIRRLNK